LLTSAIHK